MAITAASIEANGWVLRLDVSAVLGGFVDYTLDPNGTPRITLASSHPGFVKSGGEAVAASVARAFVATKPLRKPVNPASPTIFVVDETDLGGGVIRVRIALTECIYATDTGLSLSVLAGWRTGESAASGIAVTNNSTVAAPIPIMRWALAPYESTTGAFRVSMTVFSHHPNGFEPVAGVKFTATDGTTVKTIWATQLGTDNSYADNLRCYTAIIDPATATGLTAGLLRCDAEIHPWIGAMRSTDPAGTRSMATLRTDGFSVNAASPWPIGYDPAGTRYGQMWAFVDPVNGTTTPAAGMVATTLAGAKAVAAASRPRDINAAIQAGYLVNRTLAAANGQAVQTRSVDGMRVVLAAGTHVGFGAGNVTTGVNAIEIPLVVVGDPDDANPRTNVILQTAARGSERVPRFRFQNLTIEAGTVSLVSAGVFAHLDNVTQRGKAGQEGNGVAPFTGGAAAGSWNFAATRSRFWRFNANVGSGNTRTGLFRANEHTRSVNTFLFAAKNRVIGSDEDGFIGTGVLPAAYLPFAATEAGQAEDLICAQNSALFLRGTFFNGARLPAAIAGTPHPSMRRNVIVGNVMVRIGNGTNGFWSLGERESQTMSYNIIEGNTCVGDRNNTFYNDPVPRSYVVRGNTGVAANAIQVAAHGYANGDEVRYYTTLSAPAITGLTIGTTYFVVNTATNSFELAATLGGAPLAISAIASTTNGQNFANITDTNTLTNQAFVNRVANNVFDWMPSKHDAFNDPAVQGARGTNGYRPHLVDCWSMIYGVGHEGNVLTERAAPSPNQFGIEFPGLRSIDGYGGVLDPLYTDDRSVEGPAGAAATGGGSYRPLPGSPAAGRGVRANGDVDSDGFARPLAFSAGAFQTPPTILAPTGARSASRVASAAIDAGTMLAPGKAGMTHRVTLAVVEPRLAPASGVTVLQDGGARLAWTGTVAPARGHHSTGATATALVFSGSVAATNCAMAQSAASPMLSIEFPLFPSPASSALGSAAVQFDPIRLTVVMAADGRLSVHATSPLLLVPGAIAKATLVIGPDLRTFIPNPD